MPVRALGSNGSGQLGLGHFEDVSTPSLVQISTSDPSHSILGRATDDHTPPLIDNPLNEPITSIKAGGNHTIVLTEAGRVYTTGSNAQGRCAINSVLSEFTSLTPVDFFLDKDIVLIAATWGTSYFVSSRGPVFVCGESSKGEQGLGRGTCDNRPLQIPDFPPSGTHVIDISASMGHVVTVLSNNEVYGWGNGSQGQLGDPAGVVWSPKKLEDIPFPVHRVVCGKDFTCVFGAPAEGQLQGIGLRKRDRFNIRSNTPETLTGWIDVQATWGGIYVLLENNRLLAWGRDDHGQLPPADIPIVAMAAGSEHVLALTDSGKVLAWGWGEHGNCGLPVDERKDVKGRWNELKVEGEVSHIGAGCATSWVVTSSRSMASVDVEKQCGVILANGAHCAGSLACKRHSMSSKRAVRGRSAPYDQLLAGNQRKQEAEL